jgi:uncharacterized membrane protein
VTFDETIEVVGKAVDGLGVAVTVVGTVTALAVFAFRHRASHAGDDAYRSCRQGVGRSILLGLEILVAGDIIRTVAVSPTFASVGVLAVIVLIRTFLSTTLEVEIDGQWPWSKRREP